MENNNSTNKNDEKNNLFVSCYLATAFFLSGTAFGLLYDDYQGFFGNVFLYFQTLVGSMLFLIPASIVCFALIGSYGKEAKEESIRTKRIKSTFALLTVAVAGAAFIALVHGWGAGNMFWID